jgi:hypothetical protein
MMAQRLVSQDRQLQLVDEALGRNRLEQAVEEMMILFQDDRGRLGRLVEEGHIERILSTIAQKDVPLAVEAAQQALKASPGLARSVIIDSLLNSAQSSSGKNRPLALKALFSAASYTSDDPGRREKAVRQYLACAEKWKDADAKSAFDAAAKAEKFAAGDPGLQIEVREKRAALGL